MSSVAAHQSSVTAVTLHATGDFAVSASTDGSWALLDLEQSAPVVRCAAGAAEGGYTCASFHPDGLILGTGTDKLVRVWELKSQANAATLEGHTGAVRSLAFSENGYYLATGADDATVKIWDLRKVAELHTLSLEGAPVGGVAFDYSGKFLLAGGSVLR